MQDGSKFLTPAGFRRVTANPLRARDGSPVRVIHPDASLAVSFVPLERIADDWYALELVFPPEGVVEVLAQFEFAGQRVLWQRLPVLARNHFLAQLRLDGVLGRLTLHVAGSGRLAQPSLCRFERVGLMGQLAAAACRGLDIIKRDGTGVVASAINYFWRLKRPGSIVISRGSAAVAGEQPYDTWMRVFDEAPERDGGRHAERLSGLSRRPLISIVIVLDTAAGPTLDRVVGGLSPQIYSEWELLMAAPAALHAGVRGALSVLGSRRQTLLPSDATLGQSLNRLLIAARGEWLLLLRPGALLRPHALLELALTIERSPTAEAIYSDEDRIDTSGRRSDPRFKPAWSPDLLAAYDYLGDLKLLRAATVRKIGGWLAQVDDIHHDLMLRFVRVVPPEAIVHLAEVLVDVAAEEGAQTDRKFARLNNRVPVPAPLVSVIIPTRDRAALLDVCIRSVRSHTRYSNYEIIVVDNGSVEEATKLLFAKLARESGVRVLSRPGPFNFSALNNSAVREARGEIVAMVNNDIEAIEDGWLDEMVALATRPEIGCVGARLLYPDRRVQHAGIILGLGGVAGHAHRYASTEPGYVDWQSAVRDVSAVTAACLLVRRAVFDQVGGLDETLTVAFNDVDFCLKVRAAGYQNLWTPFATLIHHESASRGRDFVPSKARRFADEYATLQRRWGADLLFDPYYSPHLTYDREEFSVRLR